LPAASVPMGPDAPMERPAVEATSRPDASATPSDDECSAAASLSEDPSTGEISRSMESASTGVASVVRESEGLEVAGARPDEVTSARPLGRGVLDVLCALKRWTDDDGEDGDPAPGASALCEAGATRSVVPRNGAEALGLGFPPEGGELGVER